MKRVLLFFLFSFGLIPLINAQSGPGGVGDASNNILWLDASQLGLSDGDPVSTWNDISGNGNDAIQTNSNRQPTFNDNVLNNRPVVSFDGSNDLFDLSSHITNAEVTFFTVFKSNTAGGKALFETDKHFILGRNRDTYVEYNTRFSIAKSSTSPSVFSLSSDAIAGSDFFMTCDNSSKTETRTSFHNSTQSTIGGSYITINYSFNGYIPELILFNEELNSAERNIVTNYLATKYNLTAINDYFAYDAVYGHNLIGIGQEADGSNTSAQGRDSLLVSNPSALNDGEYLFIGNDNAGYGTTTSGLPVEVDERWNQIWRIDKTGTTGTVDLEFFLGGNGFSSVSNYVVLIENVDGDFSNGGTSIHENGRSFDAGKLSIKFTDVNLPDGAYFTLAEKTSGTITSITNGLWSAPTTWSCACVPGATDIATIAASHEVSISSTQSIYNLTLNGTLTFASSDTLNIVNDLDISGTLNSGSGTIAAKSGSAQDFYNNSASNVEFNNLYVANGNGLTLNTGDWSLIGSLQVTTGGLDVTPVNSITLISNATQTSEILPSMDDAFVGDFIVQRYISPRTANYANLSSPIENATIADWDDDLYLSGVGGADGDAKNTSGGTFYSVYTYYSRFGQDGALKSTSEPLNPGQGYEVFLADNLSTFDGGIIDYVGTPNTSLLDPYLLTKSGWTLFGNPYHAHIAYDSIEKSVWIPDEYYIYNTNNGSYDFISGSSKPLIAPGQGFWIYGAAAGKLFEFREDDKVSSKSSAFLRHKQVEPYFNLNISNNKNPFKHKMRLAFDVFATEEMDERDARHLPSPIKDAPAIYSKAVNSEDELIVNSLNPTEESQLVSVSIYAGVEGEYEINADNLDALYENYSCVYLKDKETEKAVDLMVEPKYSFEAKQGKSDRFHLILSNSYEECQALLKEGEFVQDFDQKLSLRNAYENWYVDYTLGKEVTQLEIRVYNMSGQEVKAPMSFEAHGAGTYPLQHLNDLEGIYLIQIVGVDIFLNKQVKL